MDVSRVSSRAPVWGASVSGIPQPKGTTSFQVVPPCGGHLAAGRSACRRTRFQVVPPCGGHPNEAIMLRLNTEFQVVPPCGGHPAVHVHLAGHLRVSSRAPVWGASCAGASLRPCCCFKSCPRVGGIVRSVVLSPLQQVSSRAPVWGASSIAMVCSNSTDVFQVVPPCGGHLHPQRGHGLPARFKSCPRVGGIRRSRRRNWNG